MRRRVEDLEKIVREEGEGSSRVRRAFALVRVKGGPLVKP
jgi:hypothetical protein